jgi:hypothetical protein
MLTTVAAILANPRYTGRQVWNRQPSEHFALEPYDGMDRHADVPRRAECAVWVMSAKPSHPALVSEGDFVAVQRTHTAPTPADGSIRRYALTGLIYCNICGRALDAHWSHGRPGYRCRHGHSSAHATRPSQPALLYCREDHIIELVQHDEALFTRHPALRGRAVPAAIARYLRDHGMILVGDHHGWAIESEDDHMPLTARPLIAVLQARLPTQKGREQR